MGGGLLLVALLACLGVGDPGSRKRVKPTLETRHITAGRCGDAHDVKIKLDLFLDFLVLRVFLVGHRNNGFWCITMRSG